jgi:hypothetical protein
LWKAETSRPEAPYTVNSPSITAAISTPRQQSVRQQQQLNDHTLWLSDEVRDVLEAKE